MLFWDNTLNCREATVLVALVLISLGKPLMVVRSLDPVTIEEHQNGRQNHQEGKKEPNHQSRLTVILDGSTVHTATKSWLFTERWCPATITVAVSITVTHLCTTQTHYVATGKCNAKMQYFIHMRSKQ